MALIPIESDWLSEFENCERLSVEIHTQIQQRNKEVPTSEKYQSISGGIRMRLSQFNGEVRELKRKLKEINGDLTRDEQERRRRQIELLESKNIQLGNDFGKMRSQEIQERAELLEPRRPMWQNNVDDHGDDDEPLVGGSDREALLSKSSIQIMREQNERVLQEQDEGLETLSKIISRQKDIATRIYDEVENQSGMSSLRFVIIGY